MMLVDVHCHLDHDDFKKDLDKVIDDARKSGVKAIITAGINPRTNRLALKLAEKYDIVKCSLGIYPQDALANEVKTFEIDLKVEPFNIDEEIEFIKNKIKNNKNKIIGVGEIGLDFKTGNKKEEQKQVFVKQIELAKQVKKPMIIHSRKAEKEVIDILEANGAKRVLLHCFCGKKELVKKAYDLGYYFSIPTNVVFSGQFQDIVKMININKLLTETDAPYLSPYKGKRNEPSFVTETIKKIAEIKRMDAEEVANNIFKNYQDLFLE